jgi:tRNA-splicing ligase RtcB (3'-phosphate/5'-hydroxy nucleic acid ligase)
MIPITGKYTTANIMIDQIEPSTERQIYQLVNHPAFTNPIYIMPDTHAGAGAVIGFTMEMGHSIIPNIVGRDINCGMLTFELEPIWTSKGDPREHYLELDSLIRKMIPFGTKVHDPSDYDYKISNFPWKEVNEQGRLFTMAYNKKYNTNHTPPEYTKRWFLEKCRQIDMDLTRAVRSIGTLGSGNHFIEIGVCGEERNWATLHSGSRQFGGKVCDYWQKRAANNLMVDKHGSWENEISRIKEELPSQYWQREIVRARKARKYKVTGLEYLEGDDMFYYLTDMVFTQAYAEENRRVMKELLCEVLTPKDDKTIACSHNYINFKDFIIRKGAISSYEGEELIIPFNMEEGTLICEGKGNPDWNFSAPHGAGRLMGRGDIKRKAVKEGLVEKARERMEKAGLVFTHLPADELKEAYKDSSVIENAIEPTAKIVRKIKPIIPMKD